MDNVTMIKNKLQDIEQKRMEQQQAMEQQQMQQEAQLQQMANQVKEEELALKNAELELDRYKIDQDNATKLAIAQMTAYIGAEDMDQNDNGVPDPMEIGKQALTDQKQKSDAYLKQREQDIKSDLEKKKIQLEEKRMNFEKELQSQKDKAAMEREQLKAKVAIKNKVSGEKSKK